MKPEAYLAQLLQEAVLKEREECAKIADAKRAEWDIAIVEYGWDEIWVRDCKIRRDNADSIALAIRTKK